MVGIPKYPERWLTSFLFLDTIYKAGCIALVHASEFHEFLNVYFINVNIIKEYFVVFCRENPWYQVNQRSLAAAD
jgi:hypothetical protein